MQQGKTTPTSSYEIGYETQKSDGEVQIMLEVLGIRTTPLFPSIPGQLRLGGAVPDYVFSLGQIELNCLLMLN